MTLKKMSVAANDIVLNNLVMREKTFKTIPDQLCSVLLNLQFYPTQLGSTPAWIFKSPSRLPWEPMSLALLFLIPRKFHVLPLFSCELWGRSALPPCPGVSDPVCCCLGPALDAQDRGKRAQLPMFVIFTCPWEQQLSPISSTAGTEIGDKFLLLLTWTDKTFP